MQNHCRFRFSAQMHAIQIILTLKWLMRVCCSFSSSLVARPRLHPEAIRETGPRYCLHQKQPHFSSLLPFRVFKITIVAKSTFSASFVSTSAPVAEIWCETFTSSIFLLAFAKLKTWPATQPVRTRSHVVWIFPNLSPFDQKSFIFTVKLFKYALSLQLRPSVDHSCRHRFRPRRLIHNKTSAS